MAVPPACPPLEAPQLILCEKKQISAFGLTESTCPSGGPCSSAASSSLSGTTPRPWMTARARAEAFTDPTAAVDRFHESVGHSILSPPFSFISPLSSLAHLSLNSLFSLFSLFSLSFLSLSRSLFLSSRFFPLPFFFPLLMEKSKTLFVCMD